MIVWYLSHQWLIDVAPGAALRSKQTLMLGIASPQWERGPYKNVGAWPEKKGRHFVDVDFVVVVVVVVVDDVAWTVARNCEVVDVLKYELIET